MADSKISAFTDGAPAQSGDQTAVARGATTRRVTALSVADLKTWANLAGKPATFPPDVHAHGTADIQDDAVTLAKLANIATATILGRTTAATGDPEALTVAQATALLDLFTSTLKGLVPASGGGTTNFLRADGTWVAPGGGSDPWTYAKVTGADFTTTSASAVDVTGLSLTPAANTDYEFYGILMIRTATATVNPRVGLAWPTGMTDGVAVIREIQTATSGITAAGNINAALLAAVGGLPNTTQSWPVMVEGIIRAGASPSGSLRIQLASETAGTTVRVVLGSFIRYRTIP